MIYYDKEVIVEKFTVNYFDKNKIGSNKRI